MQAALNYKTEAKVGFFGVGAMLSSVGQIVYGIESLLKYVALSNPFIIEPIIWLSALTTLYVRAKTRFPALWKQFSAKSNAENTIFTSAQKGFIGITIFLGLISGLSNSLQAYMGGISILRLISIHNKYVNYILGPYTAFTSLVSFYAFFVQSAVDNAKSLSKISYDNVDRYKLIFDIVKTILVSALGAAALGAFSYFLVDELLNKFSEISDVLKIMTDIIPSIALVATLFTTLLSRVAETYKYFSTEEAVSFRGLSSRQKLKLAPSALIGPLDIVTFIAVLYISSLFTIKDYHFNESSVVSQIASIGAALSGGFLHYIFSVRKIIKADLNKLKTEPDDSLLPICYGFFPNSSSNSIQIDDNDSESERLLSEKIRCDLCKD